MTTPTDSRGEYSLRETEKRATAWMKERGISSPTSIASAVTFALSEIAPLEEKIRTLEQANLRAACDNLETAADRDRLAREVAELTAGGLQIIHERNHAEEGRDKFKKLLAEARAALASARESALEEVAKRLEDYPNHEFLQRRDFIRTIRSLIQRGPSAPAGEKE